MVNYNLNTNLENRNFEEEEEKKKFPSLIGNYCFIYLSISNSTRLNLLGYYYPLRKWDRYG